MVKDAKEQLTQSQQKTTEVHNQLHPNQHRSLTPGKPIRFRRENGWWRREVKSVIGPRRYLVKNSDGREFVRNRRFLFPTKEQHQHHNWCWTNQTESKGIKEPAGTPAQMSNPLMFQAESPTVLQAEIPLQPLQKLALVGEERSPVTSKCGIHIKPPCRYD